MTSLRKKVSVFVLFFSFLLVSTNLLEAKTYTITPENTQVTFQVNYLGVVGLLGKIDKFKGSINWDEDEKKITAFDGKVESNSINTQNPKYAKRLASESMLNSDKNKTIVLKTMSINERDGVFYANGLLHFRGVSNLVKIPVTVVKQKKSKNPKEDYLVFSSKFDINVNNWNIKVDEALYSPTVNISIRGKAVYESWFF